MKVNLSGDASWSGNVRTALLLPRADRGGDGDWDGEDVNIELHMCTCKLES